INLKDLLYINGEWTGDKLEKFSVYNPANNEVVSKVPKAGKKEAVQAIEAADQAFETWSELTAYDRSRLLRKYYDLILENEQELAELMTKEMGKPLTESKGEVRYAADYIEWYAEEAKRIYGETIPSHIPSKRMQVWKKPIGVV